MTWIAKLKDVAVHTKDVTLQTGVMVWLNRQYGEYGEVTRLEIDSASQTVTGEIHLKGEKDSLHFSARYHWNENDKRSHLVFCEIRTSKEWLTLLANKLPSEYLFMPLDGFVATIAKKVL